MSILIICLEVNILGIVFSYNTRYMDSYKLYTKNLHSRKMMCYNLVYM